MCIGNTYGIKEDDVIVTVYPYVYREHTQYF